MQDGPRRLTIPAIGQSWQAIFAFALIGTIFLLWITIIAIQVFYDDS